MSQPPSPLRILHTGLGGWGRSWAAELKKRPDLLTTVGYVDVVPDMLELLRADLGVHPSLCFASLAEAIAATDADAVLVTTALPGHAAVAIEALNAGKHVLVEKPIAATLSDARQMVKAAGDAGRVLMVSQNYRFYPAAQTVSRIIAGKALGEVGAVTVKFRKYANEAAAGTNRHYLLPDPLLLDMSIHHFDLMRYVLGQEPLEVNCRAWNPAWSKFMDPAAAIATVLFDGGAVVNYQGSWVSTQEETLWAGEWLIECARGSIEWTGRADQHTAADSVTIRPLSGVAQVINLPRDDTYDRVGSFAEFRSAIHERRAPLTSGQANLATLALTLGAIESSKTNTPQDVPALLRMSGSLAMKGGN
ncbi:Predicted dehydrogenase [Arthrobacter sp. ov407]|uniref:Gfo/Idh/MocA family protein n=1 Tax=Arthrobacter sp. ov407 TaxID=1761748 RepID=UPI000888C93F|nr:Gfo/Idh/MocA family oxidoreductase [Arthrobacter sp. ov407]SDK93000.1 Predicted dehydrogenase [Arthrobacter sp. ov407]